MGSAQWLIRARVSMIAHGENKGSDGHCVMPSFWRSRTALAIEFAVQMVPKLAESAARRLELALILPR